MRIEGKNGFGLTYLLLLLLLLLLAKTATFDNRSSSNGKKTQTFARGCQFVAYTTSDKQKQGAINFAAD
jgi:hypothetical protein